MPFLISLYLAGRMRDFELKQRLIGDFLADVDAEIVERHAEWLCEHWLPRHLHPVGHPLLQRHMNEGHRVILLSASPEVFVPRIAQTLGIREVVCTRVKRVDGRWTGELAGRNCKGEEKVHAIRRWLGVEEAPDESYAYGDSKSDLAVLMWAKRGAWVRRDRWESIAADPSVTD
jgi:phosphatidylglycerophosphatase C